MNTTDTYWVTGYVGEEIVGRIETSDARLAYRAFGSRLRAIKNQKIQNNPRQPGYVWALGSATRVVLSRGQRT